MSTSASNGPLPSPDMSAVKLEAVNGVQSEIEATDPPNGVGVNDVQKPASAPPKVNPWKVRAGSTTTRAQENGHAAKGQDRAIVSESKSRTETDDTSIWPTLDKAVEERNHHETHHKRASDAGERELPLAPRPTGKEKWTKITPTIIHTPLPAKASRGGSSGKSTRGGSQVRHSRDKSMTGDEAHRHDNSKTRSGKPRSLSASNSRPDRSPRSTSTKESSVQRSQSSKRNEHGSTSAPTGSTPISDASKSPQVGASVLDGPIPTEARTHRGSYDSNIRRGSSYRGGRGGGFVTGQYANPNNPFSRQRIPREQFYYEQYPNMMTTPGLVPVLMDPMMARQMVLNQCEYYFSIENLCKDLFLRKHMDSEGFVNLPILAQFNRIRAITMDYALIRDVCASSSHIELRSQHGAYDKIRKYEGWEQWVLAEDQRDASTLMIPDAPEIPFDEGDTGRNVAAAAFVPGQVDAPTYTNTLTENFDNLGFTAAQQ